jgi:RimJ/RimL family protein N-acetyltransferase
MIYKTKRLTLFPFETKDITDKYLGWFQDVEVCRYNTHGLGSYIREDAEKYLEENKQNIIFAVYHTEDNKHIGNISLQSINWVNRSAEFACVFGEKEYWGQSYATEALRVLIDHGFKKMNLHRIWTGTAAPNIGMRKVAEKLDMIEEGIFHDGTYLNGKYEDVHCFGLLKCEWMNKDKDIE